MAIKHKTYYNVLRIAHRLMDKGYSFDTASQIALRIFDEYELNPSGLSIEERARRIIPAEEWRKESTWTTL